MKWFYMQAGAMPLLIAALAALANPDLKWETSKEFNIGLDWAVLDERLSGSIDVYQKKTYDVSLFPDLLCGELCIVFLIQLNSVALLNLSFCHMAFIKPRPRYDSLVATATI